MGDGVHPPGELIEDSKSPLKVKLTKQSQADVAHLRGSNIVAVGTLSRQQSTEARSDKEGNTTTPTTT